MTIAALYVAPGGCYYGLDGVEPWGLPDRDARTYAGPWPVVAHPPCERWGKYWSGGPSAKVRLVKGDDGGCFAAALASVRAWGGVLEHPAYSAAWRAFGLICPPPIWGMDSGRRWRVDVLCRSGALRTPGREGDVALCTGRQLPSVAAVAEGTRQTEARRRLPLHRGAAESGQARDRRAAPAPRTESDPAPLPRSPAVHRPQLRHPRRVDGRRVTKIEEA